jgi:hypothetical protein
MEETEFFNTELAEEAEELLVFFNMERCSNMPINALGISTNQLRYLC